MLLDNVYTAYDTDIKTIASQPAPKDDQTVLQLLCHQFSFQNRPDRPNSASIQISPHAQYNPYWLQVQLIFTSIWSEKGNVTVTLLPL